MEFGFGEMLRNKSLICGWGLFGGVGICSGRQNGRYRAAVTPRAAANIERIVARKSASAVMTLQAVITGTRPVLKYLNVCNLPCVRHACNYIVALVTPHAMISVAEYRFEVVFRLRCPIVCPQLMTYAALAELTFRGMAPVAICMCLKTDRYRLSRT
jgi:hypothetical protein